MGSQWRWEGAWAALAKSSLVAFSSVTWRFSSIGDKRVGDKRLSFFVVLKVKVQILGDMNFKFPRLGNLFNLQYSDGFILISTDSILVFFFEPKFSVYRPLF